MPVVNQDPTDPAFCQNPYEFYGRLRTLGEMVYWTEYDLPMATTHETVRQVLKHPRMGRAIPENMRPKPRADLATFERLEAHSLLEIEPPEHTRMRRLATVAFATPHIALIAPRISTYADELIDAFPDGSFDLIEAYAKPLAALTITEFLGVPSEDALQLQDWSNSMVAMYQARRDAKVEAEAEAASRSFATYMTELIEDRRMTPGADFLSQLVGMQRNGDMSEDELVSTAILLLNAGHEATTHALGNAVPPLIGYSGRADALAPDSIAGTIEECLRFRPPLHLFTRYAYAPIEIAGVPLEPGDEVGCLLASACHDDAVWPDGAKFDPFRAVRRHSAFGLGIHACLGAALARLELQIALPVLFARCPDLTIVEPPRVANLYHFHGFEAIRVTVR